VRRNKSKHDAQCTKHEARKNQTQHFDNNHKSIPAIWVIVGGNLHLLQSVEVKGLRRFFLNFPRARKIHFLTPKNKKTPRQF